MKALEPRKPTTLQLVYDVLAPGRAASSAALALEIGRSEAAVRQALIDGQQKGTIECCQRAPLYCLTANAQRPIDGRGRKRA